MKFTASALKEKLDARKWRERGGGMIARATYHTRRIDVKSVGTDFRRLRFIRAPPSPSFRLSHLARDLFMSAGMPGSFKARLHKLQRAAFSGPCR